MYRTLYRTGLPVYLILMILSVLFYQERTMLTDDAFYLFDMVRKEGFCVQRFRIISVLPQIPAWIGLKAGWSLKTISILFSLGYASFFTACYVFTGSLLRQYRWAISLLFFNVLIVTHTFYWNISELYLGTALLVPFFALFSDQRWKEIQWWQHVILLILLVVISSAHPLIIFPYLFIIVLLLRQDNIYADRRVVIYLLITGIIAYLVNRFFFTDWYDAEKLDAVNNLKVLFPHYIQLASNQLLLKNTFSIYYWGLALWLAVIFTYVIQRKWTDLFWTTAAVTGYLLLVNVSFPDNVLSFYMENMYLPVILMLGLVFLYESTRLFKKQNILIAIISIMLITSLARIAVNHKDYTRRIDWYRDFMAHHPGEKVIVPSQLAPNDILFMSWSAPFEVWLLSTIEQDTTRGLVFLDGIDPANHEKAYPADHFMTTWGSFSYKELPEKYFKLYDYTTPYTLTTDL